MNTFYAGRSAPWVLVLLTLTVLLPGTATLPLIDRDEPRFAEATVEMRARHEWVLPTFNGRDRFDKPPLTYWLMRGGYALAGVGELGARLHSILASIALVLLTWHAGRRWFDARTGFLAAAMLATCLQFFIHGRLAVADMPMVACVALACFLIGEVLGGGRPPPVLFLGSALGLGFLAKGPIAWVVPLVALALHRWIVWRKPLPWRSLRLLSAGLVALAIVAVWGVPAMVETHGQFFSVGIGEHVVQRGVERFNGRGYSPWFYLTTAPLSLFPWFGFAACAYVALRREWHARTAWLVSWLAAPYLIFTGYATQLPHYVLPAFPAFFLLVARGWSNAPAWARQLGAGIAAVFGFAAVIAAFWVIRADIPPEAAPLRVALLGAFGVFVGLASAALVFALATEFRDNPQVLEPVAASASEPTDHRDVTASHAESSRALVDRLQTGWLPLAAWLMLAVLLVVGGELALARGLRQASLAVNVFRDPQAIAADTRIVALDFAEPSLVARAGRPVTFADDPREVMEAAEKPGALVIVSVAREIDPLRLLRGTSARKWRAGTHAIDEAALPGTWHRKIVHGLNLGRTRWQELVVLERQTPNLVEPRADTNAHERSSRAKPQMNSDGHGFRPSQD